MLKATSVLALVGSASQLVMGDGVGMTKKTTTNTAARRMARTNKVGGGGNDLTEDIEFWTRMTQAIDGSIPIVSPEPTPRPTRRVTNKPTNRPPVPKSPEPTFGTTPEPTPAPTPEPTPEPVTPSPVSDEPTYTPTETLVCGLTPADRAEQFRQLALTVTDEDILNDSSSSQARALDWLLNEDVLDPPLCPDDGLCKTVQRYVMASFYFASGGGTWDQCNAPTSYTPGAIATANAQCGRVVTPFPVNNPRIGATDTFAWLTPVNECEWGGTLFLYVCDMPSF